jgi:diadenosine tetraphosphate (Ap4A) HIT family hydrolase
MVGLIIIVIQQNGKAAGQDMFNLIVHVVPSLKAKTCQS